jgi:phosphatidylglycerol:prolipoprotein diacylglycerol transferase
VIPINIDPTMFTIFGIAISWHGFFTAVGVLIGVIVTARIAPRYGLTDETIYSAATWVVIGGIIGARLLYVLEHFNEFTSAPLRILAINEGGISIFGALIGGFIAGAIYCRRHAIPVGRMADNIAPGLALGLGVGRLGDIINGEHHGLPSDLPWSVRYVHPNTLGELGVSVHPAVGYEMIWDFLIAFVAYKVRPRLPHDGMAFAIFAIGYSIGRFVFSYFRRDETRVLGGVLSVPQLTGLIVTAIALVAIGYWLRKPAAVASTTAGPDATLLAAEPILTGEAPELAPTPAAAETDEALPPDVAADAASPLTTAHEMPANAAPAISGDTTTGEGAN